MAALSPNEELAAGVEVLRPTLAPHGFEYLAGASGASSGGPFASGTFVARDRILELSFRFGLGQVIYKFGQSSIGHEDYLHFSGAWGKHKYPNFGTVPLDSFRALAYDLDAFFQDFLAGPGIEFKRVVELFASNPNRFKGFAALKSNDA